MRGWYRDRVTDATGRVISPSRWRLNTIVHAAWPLVAGLVKNDQNLRGILFCGLGGGDLAWDDRPPEANAAATKLHNEVIRISIAPETLNYVDGSGRPSVQRTNRVEAVVTLAAPKDGIVLREFGLFGGDATANPNSGYLINYVIHPVLTVPRGGTLTRRIRLSFRPTTSSTPALTGPPVRHPLGKLPATTLDGVGGQIGGALETAGAPTIQAVAELVPSVVVEGVSFTKLIELRAKARLALRAVSQLPTIAALDDRSAQALLKASPPEVAAGGGVTTDMVSELQEQLSLLQLALDSSTLRRMTLGELRSGKQ